MGIIQKQSTRSSAFIFIGFAIGALNILVLYPKFLSSEQLGLTRAMLDISLTLSTLCTLGTTSVIYKFYPFYSYYLKDKKNDLPFITASVCLIGFLLVVLGGILFKETIVRKLGKSPEFANYFYTIYPFTFLMLLFTWLEAFSWGLKKTVITNFLRETGVRIVSTLLILLYALHIISLHGFINFFSLLFLLPVIILLIILIKTGKWKFNIGSISSVTRRLKSRLISYSLFIFGAQFLNVLARTNDTILIIGLQGLAETAVFAIATYIIAVMEIPQRSINTISVPILAESWRKNDLAHIEDIYKKSTINLLVIGLGLFGLIFLNIHNVTAFLGKNYIQIEKIVFIMGLAKVIDLGTGINGPIISTSNYWKFDFYTNVFYTILSIPLNFFLIKAFGLYGIAFASLISLTIYNTVRFIFLYKKFGLQPYTVKSFIVIAIAFVTYFLTYQLPPIKNIFLDSFIRTFLFLTLFVPVVYKSNIAPDLNAMLRKMLAKLKKWSN